MAEKVTVMVVKVDLQCGTCYKKMKKLLSRTPEVRDQIFDEKQNQVIISVVTCCPDKIRDKLRSKGGKVIKSIDIKEAPKPKPKESEKPKSDDKPKESSDKPKADEPGKVTKKPEDKPAAKEIQAYMYGPPAYSVPRIGYPEPFVQYGYPVANPVWSYGEPSYEGHVGAPYYNNGYYRPVPREPCYNGYSYGNGYNEESPPMCTIV